jgi:hypothetical protein
MTSQTYEVAHANFNAASKAFREAQIAYRARKINDAEFLAARDVFVSADKAFDAAEASVEA